MPLSPFRAAPAAPRPTARGRSSRRRFGAAAFALALSFAGTHGAFAHEFKLGDLEIEHPWSRATPPGAKVAGGYFTVVNHGAAADRLISATSDIAARAEVHEMAVKDGVMTMRPVEGGLEIPAGGKVELKPGGYHLMLMDLKRPAKEGENFQATLTFEKAGSVAVQFQVEAIGATGDMETNHD